MRLFVLIFLFSFIFFTACSEETGSKLASRYTQYNIGTFCENPIPINIDYTSTDYLKAEANIPSNGDFISSNTLTCNIGTSSYSNTHFLFTTFRLPVGYYENMQITTPIDDTIIYLVDTSCSNVIACGKGSVNIDNPVPTSYKIAISPIDNVSFPASIGLLIEATKIVENEEGAFCSNPIELQMYTNQTGSFFSVVEPQINFTPKEPIITCGSYSYYRYAYFKFTIPEKTYANFSLALELSTTSSPTRFGLALLDSECDDVITCVNSTTSISSLLFPGDYILVLLGDYGYLKGNLSISANTNIGYGNCTYPIELPATSSFTFTLTDVPLLELSSTLTCGTSTIDKAIVFRWHVPEVDFTGLTITADGIDPTSSQLYLFYGTCGEPVSCVSSTNVLVVSSAYKPGEYLLAIVATSSDLLSFTVEGGISPLPYSEYTNALDMTIEATGLNYRLLAATISNGIYAANDLADIPSECALDWASAVLSFTNSDYNKLFVFVSSSNSETYKLVLLDDTHRVLTCTTSPLETDLGIGKYYIAVVGTEVLTPLVVMSTLSRCPDVEWIAFTGGEQGQYNMGMGLAVNEHGVFVDGAYAVSETGIGDSVDGFVAKYSLEGTLEWMTIISAAYANAMRDLILDPTGNVYTIGYGNPVSISGYDSHGYSDMVAIKFTPEGTIAWAHGISATTASWAPLNEMGEAVALDNHGYVYFAGKIQDVSATSYENILLAKYTEDGDRVWAKVIDFYSDRAEIPEDMIYVDNYLYIGGWFGIEDTTHDDYYPVLMKLNTEGSVVILREIPVSFSGYGRILGITHDNYGNIYAVGNVTGGLYGVPANGQFDMFVGKWDVNLNPVWVKLIGSINNDYIETSVHADGITFYNGLLYISALPTGGALPISSTTVYGGNYMTIIAMNLDGNILWEKHYNGMEAHNIALYNNKIYVTGWTTLPIIFGLPTGTHDYNTFVLRMCKP